MTTSTSFASSSSAAINLVPGSVTLAELRRIHAGGVTLQLDSSALAGMQAAQSVVQRIVDEDQVVYGINTGFGKLAKVQIPLEQLEALQANLVRSHAVGVGPLLDDATVRVIFLLKLSSLARGCSGVRMTVIDTLIALYNAQIWPCIPSQGSVGASGDLSPLAHLTLPLMGEGEVRVNGQVMQHASVGDLIFDIPAIVEFLTLGQTVEAAGVEFVEQRLEAFEEHGHAGHLQTCKTVFLRRPVCGAACDRHRLRHNRR